MKNFLGFSIPQPLGYPSLMPSNTPHDPLAHREQSRKTLLAETI
jgi:hypothetical protein